MTPPINIDGTQITGASIDGSDVSEITVDGTKVFSATSIPNSAISRYDASEESFNDNDTVNSVTDQIGTNDITNGQAVFKTNIQNGLPTFRFDGASGLFTGADTDLISQPMTLTAVVPDTTSNLAEDDVILGPGESSNNTPSNFTVLRIRANSPNEFNIFAGNSLTGLNTSPPLIFTVVFDGTNSLLRENGTTTVSGDAGTQAFESINLGSARGANQQNPFEGDIAEVVVYNTALTQTEFKSEEQRLSDKWGITI